MGIHLTAMICKITNRQFEITPAEIALCDRMGIPYPTTCREERLRTQLAGRNEWGLYPRKCDATGEKILSVYRPDSPFIVYKNEYWWGSAWDAVSYGRDIDFAKPFFQQFAELQKVVPREGTTVFNSTNCEYNHHIRESKNCYLNSLIARCEDVYYSYWVVGDKDIYDCLCTNKSTLCYWCGDINNGYGCIAVEESNNCSDCYFSFQLRGCDHCIFCTNLATKSYYIFNQKCTREEFESMKNKLFNGSYQTWTQSYEKFSEMKKQTPHRFMHSLNHENCTGDHIYNCKNCHDCYDSFNSEDCLNGLSYDSSKDVHNSYSAGWTGCEVIYGCTVMRGSQDCAFCTYCWYSSELRYCDSCVSCENCFGCIGLRHKKYCILNKQYSREEYENLVPRIIELMSRQGEWGEFFPPWLLPFAYNETAANDYMPLTEHEAVKLGYRWLTKNKKEYIPSTMANIPDNISEVSENITKEILACAHCSKNYKIIEKELKFYKTIGLPIPRLCPSCRNAMRFAAHNPCKLYKRSCAKCEAGIETTYVPDRPETVYCEKCYLETVY
ncbi:MAG: hypothetical protein ACD_51C00308G0001 [uncultured bacterium]|nr:MAG: hypothetical protein ACD_51C00308G0001 [uncultured bacterium]